MDHRPGRPQGPGAMVFFGEANRRANGSTSRRTPIPSPPGVAKALSRRSIRSRNAADPNRTWATLHRRGPTAPLLLHSGGTGEFLRGFLHGEKQGFPGDATHNRNSTSPDLPGEFGTWHWVTCSFSVNINEQVHLPGYFGTGFRQANVFFRARSAPFIRSWNRRPHTSLVCPVVYFLDLMDTHAHAFS